MIEMKARTRGPPGKILWEVRSFFVSLCIETGIGRVYGIIGTVKLI